MVQLIDIRLFMSDWLQSNSAADIAPPPNGDGIVNFLDFAVFAQHWSENMMP